MMKRELKEYLGEGKSAIATEITTGIQNVNKVKGLTIFTEPKEK